MDAARIPQMYPGYDSTDEIGRGSYGVVFVGKILGGVCAVKEVHKQLSEQKKGWEGPGRIIDKFKQEYVLMSRLHHPHIVQFFGLYSKDNLPIPALVTEKLLTDLDSLLSTTPTKPYFPLGLKFSILRDVAGGLLYLHSQTPPIIHRDLTARNVLLDAAMVAKIADFGMARLVPYGTSRLTQTPGNYCYMPPEAMGSDCKYDESLDVFSFGVLALFTLTEMFPEPMGVKCTKDGKVVSRSEVERRHTFFETLRHEVKDKDGVVEAIEKCLSDTPKGRPEVQRMLSLMQSAKEKNLTEELKMNKLELVQIIKRERELQETKVDTLKREQDDFKEKHDKLKREKDELRKEKDKLKGERDKLRRERDMLRKEKDVLRSEGNKLKREQNEFKKKQDKLEKERDELKRERDELEGEGNVLKMERDELRSERDKLKGERDELRRERDKLRREREGLKEERNMLKREQDELAMQISQKETERDREFRERMEEKDEECQLTIKEKEEEVAEIITQIKQEKEKAVAVKQKEREIVEELREILCGKPREKEEAVKQKERGINEELREELCAKPMKPNLRIVMIIVMIMIVALLCIGILSVFLLMQVQVQVSGIGEGVSLIHNESQCPGTFLQPNRTETSEEHRVQCDKCKKEQVKCKEERDECKKKQVTCKQERDQRRDVKKEGAVMIIGSIVSPPSGGIKSAVEIPQSPASLSDEDRHVLTELGLPPDQWNNLNALLALYNKTENYDVFSVQVSKPGMELSRSYILEQIEFLLAKQQFKKVILHYYGNGRRNTGDWCFRDGTITFQDIADLYMKHGRGRTLSIVTDCHSSGQWVSQCAEFLDEQGVKPCGHSAREKGILLKVYASCQTGQDSAELHYTTRAMELENGYVYLYYRKELSAQQRTIGVNFTRVRCGKGKEEECSIAPDATWSTAGEVISYRKHIVRRQEQGRQVWYFMVVDDDAEKIKNFIDKRGDVDLIEYGKVLKSGWGNDPSPEDQAWFDKYGSITKL